MTEITENDGTNNLSERAKNDLDVGLRYAQALKMLDPRLETIDPQDEAFAVDAGGGADLVAFRKLGFNKAMCTFVPSQKYELAFVKSKSPGEERSRLDELADNGFFPEEIHMHSIGIGDIGPRQFLYKGVRLLTALKMAPGSFPEEDPTEKIRILVSIFEKLNPGATMVLTEDGVDYGEEAFRLTTQLLDEKQIKHRYFSGEAITEDLKRNLGMFTKGVLVLTK